MNKKLIALAVAGACVAPAAMAQTANPVTLYGRVYVTVEQVQAKGGPSTATEVSSRTRVSDQSSLLGVRGTEDLGGGLKAFFQLETAFKPDENNTAFAGRNSAVGLQGAWGSILMGRWDTPWKTATIAVDPYGDLTLSGITGVLSDGGNFDRRDQNSIQYWSPTFGGIAFRLLMTANERKNDPAGANARDTGANVTYTGGPLYLFGAWEEHKDQAGGSGGAFGQPAPGASAVNGVPGAKESGWAAGGNFSIAFVKLGGQYQRIRKTGPTSATTLTCGATPTTPCGRSDQKNWMGNAVFTFGNHQIIYQYMQSKGGNTRVALIKPNASDLDCKSNSIGYQYNFSRRTFFIASWVRVDNNDVSSCNFGANRLTAAAGQDPEGVFAGIRHIF